ncbi:hypothetical protein TRFO_07059 [Tritrichomonas foetus]|uniref:Uncharacterized protein n=1 Tax=Tritrichomonas foetus TaxID=1144522 RepID=A0A1J4JU25_9EUKA|nr:hypothetical protein TRFO_07059 [Tritrichomonas foetus]|eukprot:OHT02633.1 hypothetical protein TRFO_07059 [Tritrichomonas foetus]
MANPGEYDISEILIHHIDHIDAQLELLKSIVYPNSRFSEALKSKQGGNFISFLQQYDSTINSRSSAPKMSDSIKSFPVEFLDQLATAVVIIDDLFNWILVARTQLQTVNDNTLDLDIRWNNNLAIHVCKVFVALTKLCLFFHYFPSCRIIVLMIEHYDKLKNQRLTRPLPELIRFMTNVTSSPFESIKMTLKPLSHKLSTLVSLIGPFMIQIFGPWPIVNWQQYMIFDRPVQTIESTLPSLHQMILINLPTLWETTVKLPYFHLVCQIRICQI